MKSVYRPSIVAGSPHMLPGHPPPPPPPPYGYAPSYPPYYPYPPMPPLGSSSAPAGIKRESVRDNNGASAATTKAEEQHHQERGTESGDEGGAAQGLELLASLALPVGGGPVGSSNTNNDTNNTNDSTGEGAEETAAMANETITAAAAANNANKRAKKKSRLEEMGPKEKLFVEKVRDCDVLCGRGGKSNHHPGNKRYRQVVSEMKRTYQTTGAKTAKTDLSRAIVEHVVGYGGRFIKRDESTGQYFLLTKAQARRKTSQALRETKELKWTM